MPLWSGWPSNGACRLLESDPPLLQIMALSAARTQQRAFVTTLCRTFAGCRQVKFFILNSRFRKGTVAARSRPREEGCILASRSPFGHAYRSAAGIVRRFSVLAGRTSVPTSARSSARAGWPDPTPRSCARARRRGRDGSPAGRSRRPPSPNGFRSGPPHPRAAPDGGSDSCCRSFRRWS